MWLDYVLEEISRAFVGCYDKGGNGDKGLLRSTSGYETLRSSLPDPEEHPHCQIA
jgi:hypothetical protein